MDVFEQAKLLSDYISDIRQRIHANPELGFEEYATSKLIADELDALGIPYRMMEPTGVLGTLCGQAPGDGKTILLRADIDALPIAEATGLPYASKNAGVSHACGHDTHAAMLLGAARILSENRDRFSGRIQLLFQPAEETGRGAEAMIQQGVLEGVEACFAEHILSQVPVGVVLTGPGQVMAGAGTFKITVQGVSCHGSQPEAGADALLAGAAIVNALQALTSREVAAISPFVLTVGTFHAGDRYNIVTGHAEMEGTVRAFDRKLLRDAGERIARIASGVAAAYRCTADTEYACTCESLITDAAVTKVLQAAARKVLPNEAMLITGSPNMGSEDFAYYSAAAPCAFAAIGGGGTYPQHNEHFTVDESAFPTGAALYAQFALEYLTQKGG